MANIIYNKFPNNQYKIRVNGGLDGWKPNDLAVNNSYINSYHIDTKEGLLIFFLEMFDYYARKNNLPENYVKLYQTFLNDISRKLIEFIKPEISNDEWMKEARNYFGTSANTYQFYLKSKKAPINGELDKNIREYLRKFDYAVNPFQIDSSCLDRAENIFERLKLEGCIYNKDDGMERKNCAVIYLTDLLSNDYVKFNRTSDGFYYTLNYNISDEDEFTVIHYFSNHYFEKFDNGEVLAFKLYKKEELAFNVRYNITLNTFGELYGEINPITLEQKKFILDKLQEAVKYAYSITINKLQTNNKKLSLTKKSDK